MTKVASNIGSMHGNSKVTDDDVRLIRKLHAEGMVLRKRLEEMSYAGIGRKFGIASQTVADIVKYRSYRNVLDD